MLLMHRQTRGLVEVEMNKDALTEIHPPECGSCLNFSSSRCRSSHRVNPKAEVKPTDESCTNHRWQPAYGRLVELTDELRQQKGNPALIRMLDQEFSDVTAELGEYFESIRTGERQPVDLTAMTTQPPAVKHVNLGPQGERLGLEWLNPTANFRKSELLPVVEFRISE